MNSVDTEPEIGYGTWGIGNTGWIGASDDESIKALHKSIDLGLNFIDTALVYGDGYSERLVGEVVKERSETIYVATKIVVHFVSIDLELTRLVRGKSA